MEAPRSDTERTRNLVDEDVLGVGHGLLACGEADRGGCLDIEGHENWPQRDLGMTILAGRSAGIAVLSCIPFRSAIIVFYVVVNLETSLVMNGSVAPLPVQMEPVPFEYRVFTKPQMAAYFDVDIRTLENWMQRGILRPRKIGRTVRFLGSDIIAMLDACRRGPRRRDGQDFQ